MTAGTEANSDIRQSEPREIVHWQAFYDFSKKGMFRFRHDEPVRDASWICGRRHKVETSQGSKWAHAMEI